MKRIIFCLPFFLFSLNYAFAQVNIQLADYAGFLRDQNLRKMTYNPREESNFAGSPYLRDTFQKGEVLMKNNIMYTGIPLRFNIYLDEVEFTGKDGEIWALSNPESVKLIKLGEDILAYRPYALSKRVRLSFFIILEEGKMSLLRKPKKFLQDPQKAGAYKDATPAKFIDRPDEYYLQGFNQAAKLITGKKELLTIFPDKQKELADFIKKNKVKPGNPETFIKLVRYYNELSTGGQ